MNAETLLLRQVNPKFMDGDALTSQAFCPSSSDQGKLSVYDGEMMTAAESYEHWTKTLENESTGTWAVSGAEADTAGLTYRPDPLPGNDAHALIDFTAHASAQHRKRAKLLVAAAEARGCLYKP